MGNNLFCYKVAKLSEEYKVFRIESSETVSDIEQSIQTALGQFLTNSAQHTGYKVYFRYCSANGLDSPDNDNIENHLLGQEIFIQGKSKSESKSTVLTCGCPIIHLIDDWEYLDVLYRDSKLDLTKRREFEIMDNSIWNYLVPKTNNDTE